MKNKAWLVSENYFICLLNYLNIYKWFWRYQIRDIWNKNVCHLKIKQEEVSMPCHLVISPENCPACDGHYLSLTSQHADWF